MVTAAMGRWTEASWLVPAGLVIGFEELYECTMAWGLLRAIEKNELGWASTSEAAAAPGGHPPGPSGGSSLSSSRR